MTTEIFARAAMADFCIREAARYGGIRNMAAVAWVLRNRVMAGWGDWYEVAATAPEKRGVDHGDWKVDPRNSQVRLFLNRIDSIHNGEETEDFTNGALYYTEPQKTQRQWFKDNVLMHREEHPRMAIVGPIWFFA